MAYCRNCGEKLDEGARFCSRCGTRLDGTSPRQGEQRGSGARKADRKKAKQTDPYSRFFTIRDTTAAYAPRDIAENRSVAVLAYLHILVLVPLLAARESRFAQYHVRLGLNLLFYQLLAELLGAVLIRTLGWIFIVGTFLRVLVWVVNLALWGVAVFGITAAVRGRAQELDKLIHWKPFH